MPREYVPQLVIHANFGWFAIEHTSNFTLLTDNPQDSGKDAFSWMGVVDVGAVMFGSMVHRDDAGALRDVIAYGIILPIFALNPRIVLNIAGGEGSFAGSARIHASLFAGMRTDIYHANITWVRWNPGCGVRCGWRVAEEKDAGILGVSCGVESPHDLFTGGPTARWSRVALGLHYGF